jgi:hypothetical protein
MAFSVAMKREERLFNVGLPLLVAAKEFCDKQVGNIYGFLLTDKMEYRKTYGKDFEEVAARYFGTGEGVFIRYVHPALPAARAGLKRGDRVLTVDGRHVEDLHAWEVMELIRNREGRTFRLEVVREWRRLNVEINGVSACRYTLKMVNHDSVNAFADGRNVGITTGMMRFIENDEELSIVAAHEISHNALGHIEKRQGNILLGTLVDILIAGTTGVDTGGTFGQIGLLAYSQSFESEADYAGLYIAARAGYDISGAANIWRRMAVEHPGAIKENYLGTHPSSPRRFLLIEQTIKEIGDKRMRGAPLVPEKKRVKQEK